MAPVDRRSPDSGIGAGEGPYGALKAASWSLAAGCAGLGIGIAALVLWVAPASGASRVSLCAVFGAATSISLLSFNSWTH